MQKGGASGTGQRASADRNHSICESEKSHSVSLECASAGRILIPNHRCQPVHFTFSQPQRYELEAPPSLIRKPVQEVVPVHVRETNGVGS